MSMDAKGTVEIVTVRLGMIRKRKEHKGRKTKVGKTGRENTTWSGMYGNKNVNKNVVSGNVRLRGE